MKISEILRKAAMEHLTDGVTHASSKSFEGMWYSSCGSIKEVAGKDFVKCRAFYAKLFRPKNRLSRDAWWFSPCLENDQAQRFMALLFAAEAAESEGL